MSVSEPTPHPEVVNRQPRVLIVGWGHVGQQVGRWFTGADWVDVDGIVHRRGAEAAEGGYDLGFICVPTPEGREGRADCSAVWAAYERWGGAARYWCVKSTVNVGTTAGLGMNVCFSPEYYGETVGHPLREALPFVILGGPDEVTRAFAEAWTLVTASDLRIYQTDSRTAELCKLMENAWIALKVTFCNQMFDLAEALGVDYLKLRELWLADPRVSRSHTWVYRNNRGFGGKCLPKDTANLCWRARRAGVPLTILEAAREYNVRVRTGVDTVDLGHASVPGVDGVDRGHVGAVTLMDGTAVEL